MRNAAPRSSQTKARRTERRRSDRLLLRQPIRINGISRSGERLAGEAAEALVISRHGALIRTAADLLPDSVIEVENPSNHRRGRFRVVWTLEKHALGKWDAGLESTEESQEIWGMDFSAAPA